MEDQYDYLSQLDEDVASTESGLEEASASAEPGLEEGALPYGARELQSKYSKLLKEYESSNQEILDQITKARNRLLSQPTEKSKSEYLRGLAAALTTPPDRSDPRFYERKNLFTFLRDVGAYGSAEEEAAKKAKLKQEEDIARLDELKAKYGQQAALGLLRQLEPAYRASMKPAKQRALQADAQKIIDLQSIIDDPNRSQDEKDAAKRQVSAIGRQTSSEDRSILGQLIRANQMLTSKNPEEVRAAQSFIAKYSTSGKSSLTLAQAAKDTAIKNAKAFLATVNERERAAAFAAPYPNERQQKIKKAVELAGQPLYEEVAAKGGFSAEPIPDDDEG